MTNPSNRLTDEEYVTAYSLVPRACVDLIIKKSNNVILTLRNIEPHKGKWHLPGGRLKKDESVTAAIQRISHAELGTKVEVSVTRLAGFMEFIPDGQLPNGVYVHSLSLVFLCELLTGELHGSDQSMTVKLFNSSDLPDRVNMIPQHYDLLRRLLDA